MNDQKEPSFLEKQMFSVFIAAGSIAKQAAAELPKINEEDLRKDLVLIGAKKLMAEVTEYNYRMKKGTVNPW